MKEIKNINIYGGNNTIVLVNQTNMNGDQPNIKLLHTKKAINWAINQLKNIKKSLILRCFIGVLSLSLTSSGPQPTAMYNNYSNNFYYFNYILEVKPMNKELTIKESNTGVMVLKTEKLKNGDLKAITQNGSFIIKEKDLDPEIASYYFFKKEDGSIFYIVAPIDKGTLQLQEALKEPHNCQTFV